MSFFTRLVLKTSNRIRNRETVKEQIRRKPYALPRCPSWRCRSSPRGSCEASTAGSIGRLSRYYQNTELSADTILSKGFMRHLGQAAGRCSVAQRRGTRGSVQAADVRGGAERAAGRRAIPLRFVRHRLQYAVAPHPDVHHSCFWWRRAMRCA